MTANDSLTEESELTPKQEQFIAALVAGNSIVVAAAAVGIGEKTAHRWLKQPLFQGVYKAAKQWAFDEALSELRDNVNLAIATLKRNMTNDEEVPSTQVRAIQVRAATVWLTQAVQVHKMEELEARLQELEAALKAKMV